MQLTPIKVSTISMPFINFANIFNGPILLIIFIVFLLVYAIVSLVLVYHWSEYGMRHFGVLVAEALYLSVSIVLFCIAFLAIHYF